MHKIKSDNIKNGIVILLFSVFITIAFVVMLYAFSSITPKVSTDNGGYFSMDTSLQSQLIKKGNVVLKQSDITSITSYNQDYFRNMMNRIIPYAVGFCLLLIVMSALLFIILKRIQTKSNMLIVNQLNNISDIHLFNTKNVELKNAYEKIQQKFTDNLNDYKRLNSYLSHEQKNALAILRTNLELSENKEYLKNIDYIAFSIDDILTLSENSEMSTLALVDVSLVCAEVCDSYSKIYEDISFDFNENMDTNILAKSRWIYRAVANLLDNAIKYGNHKPILLSVQAKKGSVIIIVKDSGIGISNEKQEIIFNNRYRINELKNDGYGIGLSLVSHVCDLCGGFVAVDSIENEGSTFYLSFPQTN